MRKLRKIIRIDEEKCDGCGLCVPACAEGAIQIIDGKARLISEAYCDGLGACLGECPQGAITIEEREAEDFDEQAVERHLAGQTPPPAFQAAPPSAATPAPPSQGCPGMLSRMLRPAQAAEPTDTVSESAGPSSQLANWPVQIHLVPVTAPYFRNARLLIAADCVPFAFADFHRRFLSGRVLLIGCPKLDDAESYRAKLAAIFRDNEIRSIDVLHMEVPCCFGLVQLVRDALDDAQKDIPLALTKIGLRGEVLETVRRTNERVSASAGGGIGR